MKITYSLEVRLKTYEDLPSYVSTSSEDLELLKNQIDKCVLYLCKKSVDKLTHERVKALIIIKCDELILEIYESDYWFSILLDTVFHSVEEYMNAKAS